MGTKLIIHIDEPRQSAITEAAAQRMRRLLREHGIAKASSHITVKTHITHTKETR